MGTRNEKILADMQAAIERNGAVLKGMRGQLTKEQDAANLSILKQEYKKDVSDAEREAVLKAIAMDSLADEIQEGIDYLRDAPTMVRRLTKQEWELIVSALRAAAE